MAGRGRPPLPIGTWGSISRVKVGPKKWVARTRFRDYDGKTRQVERYAETATAAERALKEALRDRQRTADVVLSPASRLSAVMDEWHDAGVRQKGKWAVNTARRYREVVEGHVKPGLGEYQLRELSVPVLDRFLRATEDNAGAPTAKLCRTVLSGALGYAVRKGALLTNFVRDTETVSVEKKAPRAIGLDELDTLRRAARRYAGLPVEGEPTPPRKAGRPPSPDVPDVIDLLLSTGARISEVLALRWQDFDLDAGTVHICGTLVKPEGQPWTRQEHTKTKEDKLLHLPQFAVDAMRRRRSEVRVENIHDAVFPSTRGTWRDPGNFRNTWRKVRAMAGLEDWITPHSFRRTVATLLEREHDIETAAQQLGDRVETARRHYVERRVEGPQVGDLLQRLIETDAAKRRMVSC